MSNARLLKIRGSIPAQQPAVDSRDFCRPFWGLGNLPETMDGLRNVHHPPRHSMYGIFTYIDHRN